MVPGMGHDLPPEVWPVISAELVANARSAPEALEEGQHGGVEIVGALEARQV